MAGLLRKRKGKEVASSSEGARFKTPYHEAHINSKLSARKIIPELIIQVDESILDPCAFQIEKRNGRDSLIQSKQLAKTWLDHVQEGLCIEGGEWVCHKDGRPHYLRRADLEPMRKGWYDFVCRSVMPTTNRSELIVERAVLIHSIIIGENINVEEIIAKQFYKFIYKTDLSSSLPFPSIIAALCADAKVPAIKNDNLIPQEPAIVGAAMLRTRETRARQARQEGPPPQQPPQVHPQPQIHQQQRIPSSFYTHFDASMSQIYRRLDQQQEESRMSFEAINTRMDRMDDQLSFLCYSNQMVNKTMYYPYQNTARQFREMEAQGIPVTIANLAIHRHREEEMNQERMRHNQTVQEAAVERAREENKGKGREVVPDSEEEGLEELYSSESEEW
ncbi:hypothetical protein PIB30_038987 [Stylosanthes scabra]|uniref:Putative plant transposon protein domain-containing protein n=1 Tax=Stylosanthes scabra TaxID=79078 RepID=A0ABU6XG02_9FABA|nr:hypothetical protein [Stylosanthes scabra]